jgi:hypothetical protein
MISSLDGDESLSAVRRDEPGDHQAPAFDAQPAGMTDEHEKTIELRGGPFHGRRVSIHPAHTQTTLPANGADRFGACVVYRRSSEQCADGTETWDEYVESKFGETGLGDL